MRVKALGDPTRLMLAVALADGGELCVCDLAWVAERSENLVSHHLRVLRGAGLARSRRDGMLCAYLAGALLLGLVGNMVAGAWWLDPDVGLLIDCCSH